MLLVSQDLWEKLDHQDQQERGAREVSLDLLALLVPQDRLESLDPQDFKEEAVRKDPWVHQELKDIVASLVCRVFLDPLVLLDRRDLQERMARTAYLGLWAVGDLLVWMVPWARGEIRGQLDPEESLERKASEVLQVGWVLLVLQVLQGKETTWTWLP